MTQVRKRAAWSLAIWGPVTLLSLFVFFAGGGPAAYAADGTRHWMLAALFALGYGGFGAMLFLTRVRGGGGAAIADERDDAIARRANGVALIAVLVFVYSASTTLWLCYEDQGALPVGWMWFLAYATVFLGFLSHAIATLFIDSRIVVHGEG